MPATTKNNKSAEDQVRCPIQALITLMLGACLALPAAAQQRITIGIVPTVPAASTYLAVEKGYFRDAGIEAKIETVDSASKIIPFLAQNQVQVAQGGLAIGYFNAVADGLPLILALEGGSSPLYHSVLVRTDLRDKIKSVADLKGHSVGLTAPGAITNYEFGKVLASAGLTLKDVEVKYVAFPQMGAAFANKGIDVALEVAPFTDLIAREGFAARWIDPDDFITPTPMSTVGYMANTDWAKQNPELARQVFIALAKGGRDYCQAYHHGPNRGEVEDILIKNKVMSDRALLDKMDWQARTPDGAFNVASLMDIQDFFVADGSIAKKLPAEKIVDVSYAAAATTALGPFEVINKQSTLKGCR
jgi:NitT/TauT family transport system substrate-binding protein